jgi:hypothetical protein
VADEKKNEQTEREVKNVVGDYPERPYDQAISKEHRAFLEEQEKKTK